MESAPIPNSVENISEQIQKESCLIPLTRVTTLSKYFSLTLFVILPFLGFWIGTQYSVQNSSLVTDEGGEPSNTQNEVTDTAHQSTSTTASSVDTDNCDGGYSNATSLNVNNFNSWTYSNDKFGFSIQLPSFVSPSRVTEKDPNVISVNIKNYLGSTTEEREGSINALRIMAIPRDEFKEKFFLEERIFSESKKEYFPKFKDAPDDPSSSLYIGENDTYVFSISRGHDCVVGEWCILHDSVEYIGRTFSVPENSRFVKMGTFDSPSSDLDVRQVYDYRQDSSLSN